MGEALRPSDIIRKCGKVAEAARAIGVSYSTVWKWLERDRIPVEYWRQVVRAAGLRGETVTVDELVNAHTPSRTECV